MVDLEVSLSELSIEGNNNTINVIVRGPTQAAPKAKVSSQASSPAEASQAKDEAEAPALKAKGKAKGKAKSSGGKKRFWVICRCPKDESLQGIWNCTWNAMCGRLPGHQLFGSSAQPCAGFDAVEDAIACWQERMPGQPYILHEP